MHDTRRFALPLCLLALSAAGVCAAEPVPAANLGASIDALFAPVAGKPLPGAAVLVLRDGAVVHAKGYGLANVTSGEANATTTRFRLASVTKSFTALAVLQLAEQGRLSLDDPLERYVPGFIGGEQIRLRHLLSHTAGLPDFMSVEQAMKLPRTVRQANA